MQSVVAAGSVRQLLIRWHEGLQHLSVSVVGGAIEVVWYGASLPSEWTISPDEEVAVVLKVKDGTLQECAANLVTGSSDDVVHGHEPVTAQQAGVLGVSDLDQGVPQAGEVCVIVEDRHGSIKGIKHGLSTGEVISVLLSHAIGLHHMTAGHECGWRNVSQLEHNLIPSPQADSSCDKCWVDGLWDSIHGVHQLSFNVMQPEQV